MKIQEIYQKYQIMPQLQEHQFRVAGVAGLICDNFVGEIDKGEIVTACLLHDMGNIIKFDLTKTSALLNRPIDHGHWQKVKAEFIAKYGANEHHATTLIARELKLDQRLIDLIDCIGFYEAPLNAQSQDFGKKIVQYSDDRVTPHGVVSLEHRLQDLRNRYDNHQQDTAVRDNFENALREMEKQIFARCKIKPAEITEESIKSLVEKLRNFDLSTREI